MPVELRRKLKDVMPGGAMRAIGAAYVGGEGSPAMRLIDAWLDKVSDCESDYVSFGADECLDSSFPIQKLCTPESARRESESVAQKAQQAEDEMKQNQANEEGEKRIAAEETAKQAALDRKQKETATKAATRIEAEETAKQAALDRKRKEISAKAAKHTAAEETAKQAALDRKQKEISAKAAKRIEAEETVKQAALDRKRKEIAAKAVKRAAVEETAKQAALDRKQKEIAVKAAKRPSAKRIEAEETAKQAPLDKKAEKTATPTQRLQRKETAAPRNPILKRMFNILERMERKVRSALVHLKRKHPPLISGKPLNWYLGRDK